jgi:hypothetical protein
MDTSKKTASYKFNKNLLGLSNSKVLDQAKKEWDLLDRSKYEESKKCICQHKIKYCNFYLNNINGNMIIVGPACSKKFGLIQKETSRKSFPKSLIEIIKKGEYENIEDLFKYSAEVREIYIQYFKNKIIDCYGWTGYIGQWILVSMQTVKEELEELEKKYKINWLLDLKIDLIEKMKDLKELIKVEEEIEEEKEKKREREREEREKRDRETERQREKIRKEHETMMTKRVREEAESLNSTHDELIKAGFIIGVDLDGKVVLCKCGSPVFIIGVDLDGKVVLCKCGSPVFRYPEELDACYEYLKKC